MSTYSFLEITFSYYHVHSHLLLSFGGENSSAYDFYNQIRPTTGIVSHKNRGREEFSGVGHVSVFEDIFHTFTNILISDLKVFHLVTSANIPSKSSTIKS